MRLLWVLIMIALLTGCAREQTKALKKVKKTTVSPEREAKEALQLEEDYLESTVSINPFLTPEEQEIYKSFSTKVFALNLSAIFYSPPNSKAIIDGVVLGEGDLVGNKLITKIDSDKVVLREDTREYSLRLRGVRSLGE